MNIKNKNIIITGAGEGIGKELALKLSLHNNIILIGRNIKKIEDLKNKLNLNNHLTVQCDIAVKEDLEKAYNEIVNKYQSLDILINNAGMSSAKK
ncbi:MAG: SDR family oxidoreductase, partial [Pelagibacteraceae bacterium]